MRGTRSDQPLCGGPANQADASGNLGTARWARLLLMVIPLVVRAMSRRGVTMIAITGVQSPGPRYRTSRGTVRQIRPFRKSMIHGSRSADTRIIAPCMTLTSSGSQSSWSTHPGVAVGTAIATNASSHRTGAGSMTTALRVAVAALTASASAATSSLSTDAVDRMTRFAPHISMDNLGAMASCRDVSVIVSTAQSLRARLTGW